MRVEPTKQRTRSNRTKKKLHLEKEKKKQNKSFDKSPACPPDWLQFRFKGNHLCYVVSDILALSVDVLNVLLDISMHVP